MIIKNRYYKIVHTVRRYSKVGMWVCMCEYKMFLMKDEKS
jgi:hypothetical protein